MNIQNKIKQKWISKLSISPSSDRLVYMVDEDDVQELWRIIREEIEIVELKAGREAIDGFADGVKRELAAMREEREEASDRGYYCGYNNGIQDGVRGFANYVEDEIKTYVSFDSINEMVDKYLSQTKGDIK